MALVKGTNCGFVLAAPTDDPVAPGRNQDTLALAFKDTSPAGNYKVIEIGWYCDNATQAANFDVGIYTHDAGNDRPLVLIGSSVNNAKGTDAGWKKVSGLNIPLTPSTIYWIGVQVDATATRTETNGTDTGGEKTDYKNSQTALPATWNASDGTFARLYAYYALIAKITGGGVLYWFTSFCEAWQKHDKIWKPKLLLPKEGYALCQ